jgi:hypothetical protein
MTERGDGKRLWDMRLICDSSHHSRDINTKLQGQQKFISDVFLGCQIF